MRWPLLEIFARVRTNAETTFLDGVFEEQQLYVAITERNWLGDGNGVTHQLHELWTSISAHGEKPPRVYDLSSGTLIDAEAVSAFLGQLPSRRP